MSISRRSTVRPVAEGDPLAYWHVSDVRQRPYDTADLPIFRAVDPEFARYSEPDFEIPSFPCRTEFVSRFRGRRPIRPTVPLAPAELYVPFGSPRVERSGFWRRPTHLSLAASTVICTGQSGRARFRLRTCGGAILAINGDDAGFVAAYERNVEHSVFLEADLPEGESTLTVFADDLAERDTLFYFQLDYRDGPPMEVVIETPEPAVADAMEELLAGWSFDRPVYYDDDARLVGDVAALVDFQVAVRVTGDSSISYRPPLQRTYTLGAGETSLALGPGLETYGGFVDVGVMVRHGDLLVRRTLCIEFGRDDSPSTASTVKERAVDALRTVVSRAEPDAMAALARAALGDFGSETLEMIDTTLTTIARCEDCADFQLVPLLHLRLRHRDDLPAEVCARIDDAVLGYRYWPDEPGNDVQWYFSENHALLFHAASYLGGSMLPDATYVRSGRRGTDQAAVGRSRLLAWFDNFERWELAEFNSPPYFPIDLKGLATLFVLAPDHDIKERSRAAIVRLVELVARSSHRGVMTGAQGRSYEHSLRTSSTSELGSICRLFWGVGGSGARYHALPQLALAVLDGDLEVDPELGRVASWDNPSTALEWVFGQGPELSAKLYHYKTSDYAVGSAANYRWGEAGSHETLAHVRFGTNPDAQVFVNNPGELIHHGTGRPSYWAGSRLNPRVQQYRALVFVYWANLSGDALPLTHAWWPREEFTSSTVERDVAWAQCGSGSLLVRGSGDLELVETGPTANSELRLHGQRQWWVLRAMPTTGRPRFAEAESRGSLRPEFVENGTIQIVDPEYGLVDMLSDGSVSAEGRRLDPRDWTLQGRSLELDR